jgi:hypothetical protein
MVSAKTAGSQGLWDYSTAMELPAVHDMKSETVELIRQGQTNPEIPCRLRQHWERHEHPELVHATAMHRSVSNKCKQRGALT